MALRHPFFSIVCALAFGAVAAQPANTSMSLVDGGTQVVVGRYSTRPAQPSPGVAEPLDVVVQLSFPRQQVTTIGDALQHTLLRTGYTLVEPASLAPEAARFLQLPLPESQRELGPYRVQAVLDVLLGAAWNWHRDPLRRRVWFTVAPAYAALDQPASLATTNKSEMPVADVVVTPVVPTFVHAYGAP